MERIFDKIIIGAGLYGLYAAKKSSEKGQRVLVLEYDEAPFMRATYINQARVHMGYHYPRSLTTAMKSAGYFRRFTEDFSFCIHDGFEQVYATSTQFSWTDAAQFTEFCDAAGIFCKQIPASVYFKDGLCDGAFLTREYTYDAMLLRRFYLDFFEEQGNVSFLYKVRISRILRGGQCYTVYLEDGTSYEAPFVLNASYASVNQVLSRTEGISGELFPIKYELCEIILCKAGQALAQTGITVMDGPFFSIMPFGRTGLHSLTAVTFTPHMTSQEEKPTFSCQKGVECSPKALENCNLCPNRPETAWPYMSHLADKYLKEEFSYEYKSSLYSMKPILKSSEVDDSRPTAILVASREPTFISVLSGKINTVYDLDEYL